MQVCITKISYIPEVIPGKGDRVVVLFSYQQLWQVGLYTLTFHCRGVIVPYDKVEMRQVYHVVLCITCSFLTFNQLCKWLQMTYLYMNESWSLWPRFQWQYYSYFNKLPTPNYFRLNTYIDLTYIISSTLCPIITFPYEMNCL